MKKLKSEVRLFKKETLEKTLFTCDQEKFLLKTLFKNNRANTFRNQGISDNMFLQK